MPFMLDSNVYIDIFTQDPKWFDWSSHVMEEVSGSAGIVINAVIYSEISIRFSKIEALEALLPPDVFEYRAIPREAAFLAGKCFAHYRKCGGARLTPLPDFLIGAHAAVEGLTLVTRDPKRIRTYFPSVELVAP